MLTVGENEIEAFVTVMAVGDVRRTTLVLVRETGTVLV
jgi:hypothetical protein